MKRLAIVLNPGSGKSETSKTEIAKLFKSKEFELKFFAITKGVSVLQKAIKAYKPKAVIAVGGDGTVNAVAAIVTQLDLPMGVIPAGTLNHFSKDLGLPAEPAEAAAVIVKLNATNIDYGSVNDRVFVNNCNLGGYPEAVLKRDELSSGVLNKWLAAIIAAIHVRLQHRRQKFVLNTDGVTINVRAGSLFIGNNRYQLEGTEFTKRKRLDQGMLQLVVVKTGRVRHMLGILVSFLMKRPHEKVAIYEAQQIVVHARGRQHNVAIDGEVIQLATPLVIKIHPKELQVLV